MATQVEIVADRDRLDGLRVEWTGLLRASAADCPFLTWEWLSAWWTHLADHRLLHIVIVRRGADVIGIVPLARERGSVGPASLRFLGTGHAGSDYLDLIVRPEWEDEALDALAGHFAASAEVLHLDHVQACGSAAEKLITRLVDRRWAVSNTPIGVCPYLSLDGHSWDSFLSTLGSSHRYNVRRRIRTLETRFGLRFDQVRTEDERRQAVEVLFRLHNDRWSERGGTAFHTPALRAFHDEVTRLALEQGWLRLYVLWLNGEPAAVQYLFGYSGKFFFFQHGYDAQYSRHSVGLVSFALAVRSAIEEGASEFDMLWGDESYKSLWASKSRALASFSLFPPDVSGTVQRRTQEARRALKRVARRVLHLAGGTAGGR